MSDIAPNFRLCLRLLRTSSLACNCEVNVNDISVNERNIHRNIFQEKCKDGEYYWSETKTCVRSADQPKLCDPVSEELRNNVFGEGECACTTEPPRARLYNDKDNPCHTLYAQGPCRPGQVLGQSLHRTVNSSENKTISPRTGFLDGVTDQPSCIPDPCYQESRNRKRMGLLGPDAVLAPWKNNSCHELGTRGPCAGGLTFKVTARPSPACVLTMGH